MKATRHNGRAGAHGAYNVKHNDRQFNPENSDHISNDKVKENIYWDCYRGFSMQEVRLLDQLSFEEVEQKFYQDSYGDYLEAQNNRHIVSRHTERIRSMEDILKNTKTCPEETLYQLGNIDGSVSGFELAVIAKEFFTEFNQRYGEHIHILDWALHMDETTPHIHERHVFDAPNQYGEICPQQDKALELLGFEPPDPTKKKGKYNNRKMSFDTECRKLFLEICKKHGLEIDMEPVYGGESYLEKQDYIVKKLKEENKRLTNENSELKIEQDELTVKVSDLDALVKNVSEIAYEKASEILTNEITAEVRKEDIAEIEAAKKWLASDERKASKETRSYAIKQLSGLQDRLRKLSDRLVGLVRKNLADPKRKKSVTDEIAQKARPSIAELLKKKKEEVKAEDELKKHNLSIKRQAMDQARKRSEISL